MGLTSKQIAEIRIAKGKDKVIAHRYGISPQHVCRIQKGWNLRGPKAAAAHKVNGTLITLACTGAA